MASDISRSTYKQEKHYDRVRLQQGRVQLDSDWNEQLDINAHRIETEAADVIGTCGAPRDRAGFAVQVVGDKVKSLLAISPGRLYVDGILCENEKTTFLDEQSDLPGVDLRGPEKGRYLVYLDVWRREITSLEDPEIREVALGGPDTSTRTKIVWQVKLLPVGAPDLKVTCSDALSKLPPASTGLLSAKAEPDVTSNDPCIVPSRAGYRRLENQLYRVEIHDDGAKPTFKWSRDNGSVVTSWLSTNGTALTVSSLGRDRVLGLAPGQWVELTDDTHELENQPGTLVSLIKADGQTVTIDPKKASGSVVKADFPRNPKVRRWDSPGAVPITEEKWQELEGGVQVRFNKGGTYRTGDYWLIPARTATADVEWPRDGQNNPVPQAPRGIRNHYCALAIVKFHGEKWHLVEDCRRLFPPLTEEAIHITDVLTTDARAVLLNDAEVPVNVLAKGITVVCDREVDPSTISRATCFVTLDLPIQPSSSAVTLGGSSPVGFLPVSVAGTIQANGNEIRWTAPASLAGWLTPLITAVEPRILARLTLKGSFIWQVHKSNVFLDGESFGTPEQLPPGTVIDIGTKLRDDLRLPTGDGRRGGTFEMWFWIVASLDVASVSLDPPEAVPVGGASTGTVTLERIAPSGGVTVDLSSSNGKVAQVPATVPINPGRDSNTFDVATSQVGEVTIGASLAAGKGPTAKLRVIGLANLVLNPATVNRSDLSKATVTLTGPAPKGGLEVSISSKNTSLVESEPHSVTVKENSSTADFMVKTKNFGTVDIVVKLGTATLSAPLTIQALG